MERTRLFANALNMGREAWKYGPGTVTVVGQLGGVALIVLGAGEVGSAVALVGLGSGVVATGKDILPELIRGAGK